MSIPEPKPPTSKTPAPVVFIVALVFGAGSMVCSLVAYDTPTPRLTAAMFTFGVIHFVVGLFCGALFPRYYWVTTFGACGPACVLSGAFGVLKKDPTGAGLGPTGGWTGGWPGAVE